MEKMVSIYQFAKLVGKPAQYFYGLNREGKIPEELIVPALDGKPMLKLEEAKVWYEERRNSPRSNGVTRMNNGMAPEDVLGHLVTWFEMAGKKTIARDLKKVLDQITPVEEVNKE